MTASGKKSTATRIGLVGCGNMGMGLAKALANVKGARLAAVYDERAESAKKAGEELGAEVCGDIKAILSTDCVDAVIIATPPATHEPLTCRAAANGLHVFCEKPMALSSKACRRMIDACSKNGVKLVIGHVLRYYPVPGLIQQTIDKRKAGEPFAANIVRMGRGWGSNRGEWRSQRATSGSLLHEVDIHEIDFVRAILGEVVSVSASGGNWRSPYLDFADTLQLLFRFENGATATLTASVASEISGYSATVFCTKGTFHTTEFWGNVRFRPAKGEEVLLEGKAYKGTPPLERELGEFVSAVRKDTPITLSGELGLRNIQIVEAALKSVETGKEVRV